MPRVALTLGLAAAAAWTVTDLDFFRDKKSWMDRLAADSSDSRTAGDYLRYALPREEVLYTNHLWPVLAFHSKVKTVRVWPHDLRFLDYFPHNMPQSGLFVHYREVGREPSAAWLDAQPRQVCALTGLGYSRLRNGELAEAERLLAAALDVEADSVDALIGLGLSYLRQSRKPEAAMRFRRVLELSPGNREARTHLRRAEPEERQD